MLYKTTKHKPVSLASAAVQVLGESGVLFEKLFEFDEVLLNDRPSLSYIDFVVVGFLPSSLQYILNTFVING